MTHRTDGVGSGPDGSLDRDDLLEALFHGALQLDESARADYARRHCAGDPELAEELSALLSAHRLAPPSLDRPAWGEDRLTLEDKPGDTVGQYHLVRTLGEGGMGTVYLAQQLRPLRRPVALKLIKPGMDTREVVARFDAERQVLAQLNHPHIAAVYDAGITPRGRPYFAMEYVPGERITRYCDSRKLSIRKRLLLFRFVCDAVHHAHQKGVIHRDLKPGNILVMEVDGQPIPKIIDFGVAKAMHSGAGQGGRGTLCTRSGQIIGTPSYMSPEQAGAFPAAVDSRTDVYSLGVLLNELLTGFLPYDLGSLRGASDDVVRRRLSEVEVVCPALRVATLGLRARKAAARRGCDPRGLSRQLRGDLDWIVLKALEREPDARYASASELGADIANHLDGEPVTASSPGALYRARKLIVKNRGIVASVAGLVVMGFAALVGFALFAAERNDELSVENAQLVTTHDAEMQVVLDQQETLVSACDAARDAAGAELPYSTAVIRNLGDSPLLVGEIVELVGVGDAHPLGDMVVDVVRATSGSGRPLLGSMDGLWIEQEGHDGHAHRLVEPVPPGGYGVVVTHGLFARIRVDGSCGEIRANDPLGVSAIPGLACLHSGQGAVVGFALDEWTVSQRGLIRAFVAPMPELVIAQVMQVDAVLPGARVEFSIAVPATSVISTLGDPDSETLPSPQDTAAVQPAQESAETETALEAVVGGMTRGSRALQSNEVPVVMATEDPPADMSVGAASSTDSIPAGGTKEDTLPLPILPSHATALTVGTSDAAGTQARSLRNGGVGRSLPDGTDAKMDTPPSPGDPPTSDDGQVFESVSELSDDGNDGGGIFGNSGEERLIQLWGDVDADGLLDVLIQTGDENFTLKHNAGRGSFEDITDWSGLGEHASGVERPVAWIDTESDGHLDLLAVGHDKRLRLFRGRGEGRFDEVVEVAGLAAVEGVQDVAVFDIDGNGAPDLRVSTAGNGLLLLLNDGQGRFRYVVLRVPDVQDATDVSTGSGPAPAGPRDD